MDRFTCIEIENSHNKLVVYTHWPISYHEEFAKTEKLSWGWKMTLWKITYQFHSNSPLSLAKHFQVSPSNSQVILVIPWVMRRLVCYSSTYSLVSFLVATIVQRSLVTAAVLHRSSVFLVAKVIPEHTLLPIPTFQSTCHFPNVSQACMQLCKYTFD